jgi:hypothetical protein
MFFEPTFVMFDGLFFWVFDPFHFGDHNFINSIPFLTIFSA